MRKISSFALFAFLMPLAGCPSDDTGDDGAGTTTVTPPGTDTGTTVTPGTDTAEETAEDTVTPATEDTTAGGGGGGICAQACTAVADCVPPMGNEADYACTEGFCEYVGTPPACDDTNCPAAAGLACAPVNGVTTCVLGCSEGGTECDAAMLECSGVDDDGNSFCQAPAPEPCGGAAEGAPCDFGAGQSGVCTDGECRCSDDTECTVMGQACNTNV